MTPARVDLLWAVAVGGSAFAVYVRTLAPGLLAVMDTPKFQFIGRVLGVAHNPGYPLYVFLTFPFSYLPIGTLAYRINLFSALCGALTVSLAFLIARRLGCRRVVSAAAALGMAFAHIFWSQSVIAEVYTLDTATIAGMLLALLVWGQTGRSGFFFLAAALFAAGLGNHTTIVGFAPGMAVYALLTNRRFALRARTLAMTAAILCAGLLQYGFILIRSRQPDAYVQSRVSTVGELVGVMSGAQFSHRLFPFEWHTVVYDRLPWLVGRMLAPELTAPGLVVAILGAAWLLRRRLADGLLILVGGVAVFGFVLNYTVGDTPVFLIPATCVLWLAAAVGAEQIARAVGHWPRAATAVAAVTLLVPTWHLARNFAPTDRSDDRAAAVMFEGLFEALPDRSAFVSEDFVVDHMVRYKVLGERSAGDRRVEVVARSPSGLRRRYEAGFHVFGFQRSVERLRYDGLNFSFAPLPLAKESLDDLLQRLPDGSIVALAVSAGHARRLAAARGISFAAIGGPSRFSEGAAGAFAIVGVTGARSGALAATETAELLLPLHDGAEIGETGVTSTRAIELSANASEAAIREGSRDLVRTGEGAAMVIWNPEGDREYSVVLQATDEFRIPVRPSRLSVYPLRGAWASQELSSEEWTGVESAAATGSVMLKVPGRATVVLYVGDDTPLDPRVVDQSSDEVRVDVAAFDGADEHPGRAALRARLAADKVEGGGLEQTQYVYRIEVGASGSGLVSVFAALGGAPAHALGRVTQGGESAEAAVFRIDTTGLLRSPDRVTEVLLMARDDQAQLTGYGWSIVDWDAVSSYRWMTHPEARLMLPIAHPNPRQIRMQARLDEGRGPTRVGLRFNGVDLPSQPLRSGWDAYEWAIPDGLARPLANDVVITVDRLSPAAGEVPARGIAVTEVRILSGP